MKDLWVKIDQVSLESRWFLIYFKNFHFKEKIISYAKSTQLKDLLGDLIDLFKYLEDLFDLEIDPINSV